jgi:hypothetical protein
VRLLAAAATVLVAAAVTPAHGAGSTCGLPTAKAAIGSTHLRMNLLGPGPVRVDPASADRVICFDFTADGRRDVAVSLASGGTAGDIGFVVFRSVAGGWRVALARDGYKLGLFRLGGDLVSSQPVYRKNDPNCCPTGGFDHQRFHWNGTRFVAARAWHTGSYRP